MKELDNTEKIYTVYMHTAPEEGGFKKYIGITKQRPMKRWNNGRGYYHNDHFKNAIQKYGWKNFKHEILYENLTELEADKIEKELIAKYKTTEQEYGYNMSYGGSTNFINETAKKKLSQATKNYYNSLTEEEKYAWNARVRKAGQKYKEKLENMTPEEKEELHKKLLVKAANSKKSEYQLSKINKEVYLYDIKTKEEIYCKTTEDARKYLNNCRIHVILRHIDTYGRSFLGYLLTSKHVEHTEDELKILDKKGCFKEVDLENEIELDDSLKNDFNTVTYYVTDFRTRKVYEFNSGLELSRNLGMGNTCIREYCDKNKPFGYFFIDKKPNAHTEDDFRLALHLSVILVDLFTKEIRKFPSQTEAKTFLNSPKLNLYRYCEREGIIFKQYFALYGDDEREINDDLIKQFKKKLDCNTGKPVIAINQETGEELEFKSIFATCKYFNVIDTFIVHRLEDGKNKNGFIYKYKI